MFVTSLSCQLIEFYLLFVSSAYRLYRVLRKCYNIKYSLKKSLQTLCADLFIIGLFSVTL